MFDSIQTFVLPPALRILTVAILLVAPAPTRADFRDVSLDAGFTLSDFTYGQAWADFDGDGDADLIVGRHFESPVLYENLGAGVFSLANSPIFPTGDHHGIVVTDFDNDGDPDFYLTSGAVGGTGSIGKSLYRNDGSFLFQDVTLGTGLDDNLGRGRGCSTMDLDGDGDVDIFVAKARRVGSPNSLFVNDGSGAFSDAAGLMGVADEFGSVGGIWGDYDHDGDPDLFVSGSEHPSSASRLYRNDGAAFADVTLAMLGGIGPVSGAAWGDYDNDGDLDLVVGRGDEGLFDGVIWDQDSIAFFFNARADDDGLDGIDFVHAGSESFFETVSQGDFRADLVFIGPAGTQPTTTPFTVHISQSGSPNFVPGQSVGLFLWSEPATETWHLRFSTPPGVGNNFAGVITADQGFESVVTSNLEPFAHDPWGTILYRNDGNGFTDVTATAGIQDDLNVRIVTWVDFDLDGDLDLHVLNKGDTQSGNHPNVLYENQGGVFTDVTTGQKFEGPTGGLADGISFEDIDGDGDPDAAIMSGASPRFFAQQETHRLYENRGNSGNFLRVDLQGVASTRDGLGAWVTCVSSGTGRQVRYVAGNAWRGSQIPLDPLFGIGADSVVDTLRVEWPSGQVDEWTGVTAGLITVQESVPTGVSAATQRVTAFALTALPNPSSGAVSFRFSGGSEHPMLLEIFDPSGRRVFRGESVDRSGRFRWNGRGSSGHALAAGVYFAVARQGQRVATRRITLIR